MYAGLGLVVVALALPLDVERRFDGHMAQHLLLGDLAPLLVVLGLDGRVLRPLLQFKAVRSLRVLAHPLVALPLWAINLCVWHTPALYVAALRHDLVHALEHGMFFACGALMFGGGAVAWLARKTHVARMPWILGRPRARSSHDGQRRQD